MVAKYTGPIGKGFAGNRQRSMELMGQARLLVAQLVQKIKAPPFNGKGFQFGQTRMADGSVINAMVNMIGAAPIIRTWVETPVYGGESLLVSEATIHIEGFLETGYIVPVPYYLYVHSLNYYGQHGKLYYPTQALGAYNARLTAPSFLDELKFNVAGTDQYSLNLADAAAFKVREYTPGMNAASFLPFEESSDSVAKAASLFFNANYGAQTGKMALFAQSYYGAKAAPMGETNFRTYVSTLFASNGDVSYGLLTVTGGAYKIIRITQTTVAVSDLIFRPESAPLIKDLAQRGVARARNADLMANKVEAYLFTTVSDYTPFTVIAEITLSGRPISYGVDFSWDGREAQVVTQELIGSTGYPLHLVARHYKFSFSFDADSGSLTAAFALHEEAKWTPSADLCHIWYPTTYYVGNPQPQTSYWYVKDKWAQYQTEVDSADVPVYGFYDSSGAYKIVRFKYTTTHKAGVYPESEGVTNPATVLYNAKHEWEFCGSGGSYSHGPWQHYYFDTVTKGFYVTGGPNLSGVGGDRYLEYQYDVTLELTTPFGDPSGGNNYYLTPEAICRGSAPEDPEFVDAFYVEGSTCTETLIATEEDAHDAACVLIIPYHSAEAAYIGICKTTHTFQNYVSKNFAGPVTRAQGIRFNSSGEVNWEGPVVDLKTDYGRVKPTFDASTGELILSGETTTSYTSELHFVSAVGTTQIFALDGVKHSTLFFPNLYGLVSDENLLNAYTTQISASGISFAYTGDYEEDELPSIVTNTGLTNVGFAGYFTGWL